MTLMELICVQATFQNHTHLGKTVNRQIGRENILTLSRECSHEEALGLVCDFAILAIATHSYFTMNVHADSCWLQLLVGRTLADGERDQDQDQITSE